MSTHRQLKTGDVMDLGRVAGERGDLHGIAVRLVGHEHYYVVGITTGSKGPRLVDLQIRSETDAQITPQTLRGIPSRRLAYAAARYALAADGVFADPVLTRPGDEDLTDDELSEAADARRAEASARPEAATARRRYGDDHYREVAQRVRAAVRTGHPIRKTVAAQMHCEVPTVDRWIRKAKDLGFLGEDELPRRQSSV
ncbi:hypothetical protein [Gordonia sp. CPCC 205333]|uniref:hypothetical protein n=1 Tax=Gordonia sp. CPCC 205333 TaxID=3140790 RepID=UPI003AF3E884